MGLRFVIFSFVSLLLVLCSILVSGWRIYVFFGHFLSRLLQSFLTSILDGSYSFIRLRFLLLSFLLTRFVLSFLFFLCRSSSCWKSSPPWLAAAAFLGLESACVCSCRLAGDLLLGWSRQFSWAQSPGVSVVVSCCKPLVRLFF